MPSAGRGPVAFRRPVLGIRAAGSEQVYRSYGRGDAGSLR